MAIIRGTTPTLVFKIKNENMDLDDVAEIWITLKTKAGTRSKEKTYDIDDVTIDAQSGEVTLSLSQEDTLYFEDTNMLIQIRLRMDSGMAYASSIIKTSIGQILQEGVI